MAAAAQAAFTEMKQSSCSPNVFTYTSLLQAYKVAGRKVFLFVKFIAVINLLSSVKNVD